MAPMVVIVADATEVPTIEYAGRVNAVTPEEIQAAAGRSLSLEGTSLVIVGDASLFIDELRATYPDVEVIPLTELDLNGATLR